MVKNKKALQKENYDVMLSWYTNHGKNPVERFIFLWIMFNHWYRYKYSNVKNTRERDLINVLKNKYGVYHSFFTDINPELLKKMISNMEILKFKNIPSISLIELKTFENYKKFIESVYELRNKIFHGTVSLKDKNVRLVCENTNQIFRHFFGSIILPDYE